MAVALFITEQFIKDNTLIDGNVDMKYITTTIADAQRLHILPILGTALYNQISAQIIAGSVSANNQTLLDDYIQDALKYWVIYEGIDLLTYKFTNKSIMLKNSDNSNPIDQIDVIRLMDRNKEKAEWFSQRLTDYLLANTLTYPLYMNPGTTYDTIQPNYNNYNTGWNIDDRLRITGMDIDYGCDC